MTIEDPIVGSGHGIEHLMIVVSDLAKAIDDYQLKLGFQATAGTKFPDGIENASIELQNEEYLELLALYGERADSSNAAEVRQLLSRGEGACGFGIQVSSVESAASHIRANGLSTVGPTETKFAPPGSDSTPVVSYRNLQVKTGEPALDEVFFFTEPQRDTIADLQRRYPDLWPTFGLHCNHPNSAIGQTHPWLAVSDLDQVAELYGSLGFRKVRDARLDTWNCDAREFKIGVGTLILLASRSSTSPVFRVLEQRGTSYAVLGVTLSVRSFQAVTNAVDPLVRSSLQPTTGLYGPSLLVPPEFTHGVWLEVVEA